MSDSIKDYVSIALQLLTMLGVIFAVYQYFRKPDEDADKKISLMEQACVFKHTANDKSIFEINQSIQLIKENHLAHIEASLKQHDENFVRLFTMLEERLPKKD